MLREDRVDLDKYNEFYMSCDDVGKYLGSYFLTQVTVEGLYVHITPEEEARILKVALEKTKSHIDAMIETINNKWG